MRRVSLQGRRLVVRLVYRTSTSLLRLAVLLRVTSSLGS